MHKRTGHFFTNPNLLQKFTKYDYKFKVLSLDWLPIGYMNGNYGKDNNVKYSLLDNANDILYTLME